ncbi:MAG TPA: Ada metal-binding domain-containing protein [Methanotrichaceae archaeon]|nr:Ada metal-binding domain-containing protein [Methanotrichaceae archaeon]HQF16495.1 Ada metal-binding domain-containing protein [Methanotrichaceae archaeon]HQI91134.1 Ada metal-binding domain-containing protein [Methanotrichaceae archaeon]HQJ28475.1 Ada metal-binding domain-containing protein [Methanotrichaceae archaeon]
MGSVKEYKYHYPSCYWATQISPQNEIWFYGPQDARANGFRPCKVCDPPGSVPKVL